MKKFIIIIVTVVLLFMAYDVVYYRFGWFIDLNPNKPITTKTKVEGKTILLKQEQDYEEFEIKGVNLGAGIPGHYATEYAISKDTYKRWFKQIQEMGANTIRVYTILGDEFYNAIYEYNKNNDNPLYIIHGLWVNDYVQNSHVDAYAKTFFGQFLEDSKKVVDVIHGKRKVYLGRGVGSGMYNKDISEWVIGYILGVEWEDVTVEYTNHKNPDKNNYQGKYMYTTKEASPFEAMLAEVGDKIIEYESKRYKEQRLVAFSNWPTTDPFDYPEDIRSYFRKIAKVDVEHIKTTNNVISGTFASYHVYPYYPDYLSYYDNGTSYLDENGNINTYLAYLKMLNDHHSIPVVIAEFGVPSSRGMAQRDKNTGRNQGGMSEQDQGEAIVTAYQNIKQASCAGSIVFTWQDEWFKRTWNTMHNVDLNKTPYWSDYQTNEQYFGLLSFDPGNEKSISYVDGDVTEWKDSDIVAKQNHTTISMKYDEKFVYFRVNRKNYQGERLYIPIDTTQKSGSKTSSRHNISFTRAADFLIVIDGKDNSRLLVQDRYDTLTAMFSYEINGKNAFVNPPAKNSPDFQKINLMLQTATPLETGNKSTHAEVYETGKLTYGNANPKSKDYNSLADYIINKDDIEIRIPWQMLNFADPSNMQIHDDYYEKYGVEDIPILNMYIGVGDGNNTIQMNAKKLKGWGKKVTYHERLKESYYMLQKVWKEDEEK